MTPEIRFIAATGAVGAGVDPVALDEAMAARPHFIAADAGTTDAGPFSLGSGQPAFSRQAVKRDLDIMLRAARRQRIPTLIGSAGTAGGDEHVDWTLDIVREICAEAGISLRVAVIYAEQDDDYLIARFRDGRIHPLRPAPDIDEATFKRSSRIVGMMGVEPLQDALRQDANLVLAGRCSDAALFAAHPIMHGLPAGLSWHAGKIVECGTLVCEQLGPGVIFGTVASDHVIVRSYGSGLRCTPQSVAAHSLYENANPYFFPESSGTLDISSAIYEAVDDRTVRITGSEFIPADTYTVKLEGAELGGYQTIIVGGVRDPLILGHLDRWLGDVRRHTEMSVEQLLGAIDYSLTFHVYGRDAVMQDNEPCRQAPLHEVGIVAEATAPTQELATIIAKLTRQPLLHTPIPEWTGAITGFACLHNPAHIERGPVYQFTLHHTVSPAHHTDMFRTELVEIS